jgi:DNA-binding CsgD family transcriptional regulator/tetratricopeptide (TPR) repeat protein
MAGRLLEREAELAAFQRAIDGAKAGRGSVVAVTGEAGIGKTTVIRAFRERLPASVRVLVGACDDLLAPPVLGPLVEAVRGTDGPLAQAIALRGGEDVLVAAVEELISNSPTVLIVEDVHWADDATIDLLRYLVRRLDRLPTVLVISVRDGEVRPGDRLEQLLATIATTPASQRLALQPLSPAAVDQLANDAGREAGDLDLLTGGNPFYLTEVLAGPPGVVPTTVADTVLARVHHLPLEVQRALEQLSVIPTVIELPLAEALLGAQFESLAEAERLGMIQIGENTLTFRHELARRAIEGSMPALRRRACNRAIIEVLRVWAPTDLSRIVHHAVLGADSETVVANAPTAARAAADGGSHRQALTLYGAALRWADRLAPLERARVLDEYAWELYNAHRFDAAVAAGRDAVERFAELGEPVALGEALLRLSRHIYMTGQTDDAEQAVSWAVDVLEPAGSAAALAHALTQLGSLQALTGRSKSALLTLERAERLAEEAGRRDLLALALNYHGVASCDLEGEAGLHHLQRSLVLSLSAGAHEYAARAYTNLGELLYRFGHYDELSRCIDDGLTFTRERGFWSHAYNLELHRCLVLVRQTRWDEAQSALGRLVDAVDEPGMLYVYSVPPLARLLARRGQPLAEGLLTAAWERAVRQKSVLGIAYAGIAYVEWAWLTGRSDGLAPVVTGVVEATQARGAAPLRAEFLRYMARTGYPEISEPVVDRAAWLGGPEPWAAGLRGDWRAAATAWHELGDRYEEALELAAADTIEPMVEALSILDELDARPAAAIVRARLKALGMTKVPRGPLAVTRANLAGLTERQLDVLSLLADDMTNAEIAQRLVISVRTVDHHVSAILSKLSVRTRREAVLFARTRANKS